MDEQIKPVAWVERTEAGLTRMWSSDLSTWTERPANPEPLYSQQSIDALRAEVERYRALEAEAAQFVEVPIINRTKFTGDEPYVGWRGLGQSLNEALDERDALRAEVEFHKLDAAALRSQMDALRDGVASERERAERAEAEARIGQDFLVRVSNQDAAFRPGWVHWCELARQGLAAIDAARKGKR